MSKKVKLKKAKSLYKEAESLCRKTIIKWSSDWNGAAPLYERAALMFKSCEEIENALTCFMKAGEANEKCNNLVMAGKNYEQAGKVLLDLKRYAAAIKVYDKGHKIFYEDGKADRAMNLLIKAAEIEEKHGQMENVKKFYENGLTIMMDNDKLHHGMRHFNRYNAYLLRHKLYDDAIKNVERQKESFLKLKNPQYHNVYKANLAIIVTLLAKGDLVEAEKYQDSFLGEKHGYEKTDESDEAERLLNLFDQRDIETYNSIKKKGKLKFIEPAFVRLARKIESMDHVFGNRVSNPSVNLDELFNHANDKDEDEDEDGLETMEDFGDEEQIKDGEAKKKKEEIEGELSTEEEDDDDSESML